MIENHQLIQVALTHLHRLGKADRDQKEKLNLLRMLMVILVKGDIVSLRSNCDPESPL